MPVNLYNFVPGQVLNADEMNSIQADSASVTQPNSFAAAQTFQNVLNQSASAGVNNQTPFLNALDVFSDFIASGVQWVLPNPASLTSSMSAGVAYLNGQRTIIPEVSSYTFPTSSDTYVCINNSGGVVYNAVASGSTAPTPPSGYVQTAKITTNGSAITSVDSILPTNPEIQNDLTVTGEAALGIPNSYNNPTVCYNMTYGRYRHAVAFAAVANSTTYNNVQVVGGGRTNPEVLASYTSRDSVAAFISNYGTVAISGSSTTFTSTSVTATWSTSISKVPVGAFVDVQDGSTLYTGTIQSINGDTVNVDQWTISPSSPIATGTPTNGSPSILNPQTKIWGQNAVVTIGSGTQPTACAGYEMDIVVNETGITSWGYDCVNLGSEAATIGFVARGQIINPFAYLNPSNNEIIWSVNADGSMSCNYMTYVVNLAGKLPANLSYSGGGAIGWNYTNGGGETDFFNSDAGAGGGFNFYNVSTSGVVSAALMSLNGAGALSVPSTVSASAFNSSNSSLVNAPTSGSVSVFMPLQGNGKMVVLIFNSYENDTTTAQTINFPTPFTQIASIISNQPGLTLTTSLSGVSVTAPDNTTTYSGTVVIMGN